MTPMHVGRTALALVMGAALVAATVEAQGRRSGPGMPRYDKAAEVTLTGTVDAVQPHQGRKGGSGLHLAFKAASGTISVHVGPTRWLEEQQYTFAPGDTLTIVGAHATVDGEPAFLAREITKGTQTMVLRNEAGFPRWSGRGPSTR